MKVLKYAAEIGGAGAGGYFGSWLVTKFLLKTQTNPGGFIESKDGFGLDDVVLWAGIGIGGMIGVKLAGKLPGMGA